MSKFFAALTIFAMLSSSAPAAQYYWDADTDPSGNDATLGTNLGNSGTWDNLSTANWWDGVSATDSQWDDSANSGAIFWGNPGAVTLGGDRTASSLAFKSDGYALIGATLNLTGPAAISIDPFLSIDIGSIVAGTNGYSVSGGGTLNLNGTAANTITGPVSVSGGSVLQVPASNRIGGATGDITLDNGTLRNLDSTNTAADFVASARNIAIGSGGGTIDVSSAPAILAYAGAITGPGNTLTKTGAGELRLNGSTNFTFEKLRLLGGTYTLGQAAVLGYDGQLGAVPASFMQDQITMDGGTLRFNGGSGPIVLNANRGITLDGAGGTFHVNTAAGTIPGKISGVGNLSVTAATLASTNVVLTIGNNGNDWAGTTTITSGTLRLGASGVIPDTSAVTMGTTANSILDVNGMTETIASLAGGAAASGGIQLNLAGMLTVGADNTDTTYLGPTSGTGTLIKTGTGTLTFNGIWSHTGGVIITDGTLKFSSNNAGLADAGLVTINSPGILDMNSATPANDLIGDLAGNGTLNNLVGAGGANNGLRIGGTGTTTFSGTINGSGTGALRILKTAGSLTLTGNNTYTGGTIVTNGKLIVNNTTGSGTGTGDVTISGTTTLLGTVAGKGNISGAVFVSSGGHLAAGIGGANAMLTTTKVTTVSGGHIDALLGAPGNSDVLKISTPTTGLTIGSGTVLTVSATTGSVLGTYPIIDYDTAYTNPLANFSFDNATGYEATLVDNTTNTTIDVNVTNTVQDRKWVKDAATGNWSAAAADATNWGTLTGQPNGPGAIAQFVPTVGTNPGHTVTITDSNKTVGTLVLDSPSTSATTTGGYTINSIAPNRLIFNTYSNNAALNVLNGVHTIAAPITITAPTDITVDDTAPNTGALTLSGVVTNNGNVTKLGSGTLTITQNWAGSGTTTINAGTLKFSTGSAGLADTSLLTINGAASKFDMNGIGDQFGDLAGDGQVVLGGSSLRLAGALATTFSGSLIGSSPIILNKTAGSFNITSSNTNTGLVTVNGGNLRINNTDLTQQAVNGGVTVTSTATLAGTISGTGSIGGLLTINSGGTLSPGNSIGKLTAKGGLLANAGSILNFELDTVAGNDVSDLVDVTAANGLTLSGGTINLINAGAMTGGTYTLIDYVGTLVGSIGNMTLGSQPAGFTYQLVNNTDNTSIDVLVSAPGVPGDYNGNGTVDAADYILWRKGVQPLQNEVAAPIGTTDGADYDAWRARFGNISGSGSELGGSGAVPEPSAVALVLMLAFTALTSRRCGK